MKFYALILGQSVCNERNEWNRMVATIAQMLGKLNPEMYAENGSDLLKKYGSIDAIPAEEVKPKSLAEHKLTYDSPSETLEPVYFFLLDLVNDFGLETEKLIDNFTSSPGSGHFSEQGQKATLMQQQAGKIMGDVNTVLRSVLNIIYDLKEFKIRLSHYEALKTSDKDAATLALKQIWLDKVDINKGNSSIKAMALGQAGFQTLLDAFLVAKDAADVDKIDLNDRVKRILKPRILEFNDWIKQSEIELRKRYALEREYLKSQVNSLKLYSRWVRPYLLAAQKLEMQEKGRAPELVNTFNTILLELTLIGKKKLKPEDEVKSGNFPVEVEKIKDKRDYFSCVLIDFKFRGIPQKAGQQHYSFGGRADISFKAYSLNKEELDKLNEELDSSDIGDVLKLIEGASGDSLKNLQDEIDFFLEEAEVDRSPKQAIEDQSNPFKAIIGGYNSSSNSKSEEKPKELNAKDGKKKGKVTIKRENYLEKTYLRPSAAEAAKDFNFKFFDIYKKAHDMASYT